MVIGRMLGPECELMQNNKSLIFPTLRARFIKIAAERLTPQALAITVDEVMRTGKPLRVPPLVIQQGEENILRTKYIRIKANLDIMVHPLIVTDQVPRRFYLSWPENRPPLTIMINHH